MIDYDNIVQQDGLGPELNPPEPGEEENGEECHGDGDARGCGEQGDEKSN